jgi:O-antigen/teichoic acid export membrane protein
MRMRIGLPTGGGRLVRNAIALLISNATGAVLGVAFWAAAARLFTPASVGDGVAEIAAMTFLCSLAQLNLGSIFPRFLYPAGAKAAVILRAGYAASAITALLGGISFLRLTGHHSFIQPGFFPAVYFLIAVVLWTVFTIEDAALTGLRATFWVPVENTSFSLAKILLLPVFSILAPVTGVFDSWTVPLIGCILPVNYYLFRKVLPAHIARSGGQVSLPSPRAVGSIVVGEYCGGLALVAQSTAPALLIVDMLGPTQTAYFQTPWLAGTSFDLLLYSIGSSLIVEASADPDNAAAHVRTAVRLALRLLIPGLLILVVAAPLMLRVIGAAYAEHGTRLLQSVALALPFMGINVLYITFARMARRVRRVVAVTVIGSAMTLTLTALLIGPTGITGAGLAFLGGQVIMALILLPSVVRQYRRVDMAPSFAPGAVLLARGATRQGRQVKENDPEEGEARESG